MTSVGSLEAKAQLPALLARVAKGEEILITRRGKPVALLVPPPEAPPRKSEAELKEIVEKIKALGRSNAAQYGGTTVKEIKEMMNEGRR